MRLTELIVGLFLIALGFLFYYFPNIVLAGYNTMSKAQKKKIDINSLKRLMRNAFVLFGLFAIITSYSLAYLGMEEAAKSVIPVSTPCFAILLAILTWKYNK